MKRLIAFAILIAGICSASAQTNTNTPPTGLTDFGNTVLGFFTSFNPALDSTFGQQRFDLWLGVASLQNGPVPIANEIGLSYDLARFTRGTNNTQTGLSLENTVRNGGTAGTLISDGLGFGFSVIVHDVKLIAYAEGVYDLEKGVASKDRFNGEVGLRVKKALGTHFYSYISAGALFPKNSQIFGAGAGLTF